MVHGLISDSNIFFVQAGHFGARNKDVEAKLKKDLEVLMEAFERETNPYLKDRYTFYIGTSYCALREVDSAIKWLKSRFYSNFLVQKGSFEVFCAGYKLADLYRLKASLHQSSNFELYKKFNDKAKHIYLILKDYFPNIKEPTYQLSIMYSTIYDDFRLALTFAVEANKIMKNRDRQTILEFEDQLISNYGIDYQILFSAYKSGNTKIAKDFLRKCEQKPFLDQSFANTLSNLKSILY